MRKELEFLPMRNIPEIKSAFETVANPATLFYLPVSIADQKARTFLEPMSGYYGHVRVFTTKEEVNEYMLLACGVNSLEPSSMKFFELGLAKLIEIVNNLSKGKDLHDGILVSLNKFDGDVLKLTDILWDHRSN